MFMPDGSTVNGGASIVDWAKANAPAPPASPSADARAHAFA